MVVNVGVATTPGQYDNTASASASNHATIDDVGTTASDPGTLPTDTPETDEDVTVLAPPALLMDKDTSTPTVVVGGQATYPIVVRNNGGSVASGVTISDTLPAGFTYAARPTRRHRRRDAAEHGQSHGRHGHGAWFGN